MKVCFVLFWFVFVYLFVLFCSVLLLLFCLFFLFWCFFFVLFCLLVFCTYQVSQVFFFIFAHTVSQEVCFVFVLFLFQKKKKKKHSSPPPPPRLMVRTKHIFCFLGHFYRQYVEVAFVCLISANPGCTQVLNSALQHLSRYVDMPDLT